MVGTQNPWIVIQNLQLEINLEFMDGNVESKAREWKSKNGNLKRTIQVQELGIQKQKLGIWNLNKAWNLEMLYIHYKGGNQWGNLDMQIIIKNWHAEMLLFI